MTRDFLTAVLYVVLAAVPFAAGDAIYEAGAANGRASSPNFINRDNAIIHHRQLFTWSRVVKRFERTYHHYD
jgi:hypothetical protein